MDKKRAGRRAQICIVTEISRIKDGSFVFKSELKRLTRVCEALAEAGDGFIVLSSPYGVGSQMQEPNPFLLPL